ncbi:hypothetical protein JCGZ_22163 [Jatropha curcas]|uniref:Uncharacterized protein n=1 Tax=Jatropha curcas TaxID=180498 RepID=A0A067L7Z3_JATCU|nr:hypothetical protein JCGZ_22163 [Jatropha curcas]
MSKASVKMLQAESASIFGPLASWKVWMKKASVKMLQAESASIFGPLASWKVWMKEIHQCT